MLNDPNDQPPASFPPGTDITLPPLPPRKYTPTNTELAECDRRFTYHAPKPDQQPRYREIRSEAQLLAHIILTSCPVSRERATALTKLDEVVMHANAAIARHED